MNPFGPSNQVRSIRVFVSSTFRDMHAERDYLIKFIFPQLRKLCEQRGVVWGEVDLRWGVTDEQKAEGKVLPICLEEIKRCRPFFIGILGNRYGWVPDEIPPDLIEREEWLKKHHNNSVTELEILHGVLRNPEMTKHAFFYFRDPEASLKVEEELKKESTYIPEPEVSVKKLASLKQTIRAKGFPVRENYTDPKALGKMVMQDMTAVIDTLYPESSQPDPLDRDAMDHETFAQSRARVYIGREEYFRKLDEHVIGESQPLVITGESGSGKSALLSNWALRFRKDNPDTFLFLHFIGASSYSADWASLLRRIMGEFKRRFDIRQDIPVKPDELRSSFANWLSMASSKGRMVLILDALNQLEDRDGASDLVWLPPVIPSNVRMILSTLPGKSFDDIKKRSWQTILIEQLNENERSLLISEYLKQYTKSLSTDLARHVALQQQAANPLYLKALLEELRLFGRHEELEKRINHYLEAKNVPDLFMKILARYEEDYESERPGLVRDVMTSIWAARRGLQESELLDILGKEGQPLPQAIWTPLYLTTEHSLVNRSGLINFSHEYFRKAVQEKFIHSDKESIAVHNKLARYFSKNNYFIRAFDETLWQYSQAGEWEILKNLLTQSAFFIVGWRTIKFDIMTYWAELERNTYSAINSYRSIIDNPENADPNFLWRLSELLLERGYSNEALILVRALTKKFKNSKDFETYQYTLGSQAMILRRKGVLNESMELSKEQEQICRELGNKEGLSDSLINQANICFVQGQMDDALKLNIEVETICRESGNKRDMSSAIGNQAMIYQMRGRFEEAIRLFKEEELICRELGDKYCLSRSINNQATLFYTLGKLDEAMRLNKECEYISRELGNKNFLQSSIGNQATIFATRRELDEAMRLFKEQESISRELGNKGSLATSLGNQASICYVRQELNEAMRLHKEEEQICNELGDKNGLQFSLSNQALILQKKGEIDEALRLLKVQEQICIEIGKKDSLAFSLGSQGNIYFNSGKLDDAQLLYIEQEKICRELGNEENLRVSRANQANIFYTRGDQSVTQGKIQEAIVNFTMAITIQKQLVESDPTNSKRKHNLSLSYDKIGDVQLSAYGDSHGALKSFKDSLYIREQLTSIDPSNAGWQRDLGVSYWKIASALDTVQSSEARNWWHKVYNQFLNMKQKGLLDPRDEKVLENAKSQAEKYDSHQS